ncbi:hypothetical protein EVJ58_g10807, partial [Rhodofomes roseus]
HSCAVLSAQVAMVHPYLSRDAAAERDDNFVKFCESLARTPAMFTLEKSATSPQYQYELADKLQQLSKGTPVHLGPDPFTEFIRCCDRVKTRLPAHLRTALAQRKADAKARRKLHSRVVAKLRLKETLDRDKVAALKARTTQYDVKKLNKPYPHEFKWVCEDKKSMTGWGPSIRKGKQADERKKRRGMHTLKPDKLQLVVSVGESAMIRDADSGDLIAVVVRGFCEDHEILDSTNLTVTDACDAKRNVRKEDQGTLVMAGYTAGALSAATFDWTRNILSKKHSESFIHKLELAVSSSFTLFYNKMRAVLPAELLADYEQYLETNGFPRMDANGMMGAGADGRGEYYVQKGSDTIVFRHEKLAPPAGVMGTNYTRSIHWERAPHKYAYSWTTNRTTEVGGHFYIATYGIKIEQSANTFIAWQPRHAHGTSLIGHKPPAKNSRPPFAQQGLSFVSSMRLASTWQKYKASKISVQQAVEEYAEGLELDIEA